MPSFESKHGRPYEVDGRYLIWHPETWEGEPPLPDVRIPLRIKLGVILSLAQEELDATRMREMILVLVPEVEPVIEEMDLNDFQDMFMTWQRVYNSLTGAGLGESSPSAGSSNATEGQPSTTSARASTSRSRK